MVKQLVPDELWMIIEPLLPPGPPKPNCGRPRVPDRAALAGIIYILKSGIPWGMLPKGSGFGSGVTRWRRLRDWQKAGVWRRLHRVLLDELGKAGLIDWSRVSLSPDGPGFMDAWEFLSLSRMLDEWRIWKGLLDGGDLAGAKGEPEEGVADDSDDWWNPKWVPLTYSGSGDHHCLDLAPKPDREVGQIILMYHDVPTRQVVARSFGAWLKALADDLEAGRYVYDEGQYHGLVNKDEL